MPFLEALKLAISAILSHKLRSFLTLLGVIFGVATVIVVVSLIEGFNAYVDEKIANIGTNAFAVQQVFDRRLFERRSAQRGATPQQRLTLDDAAALRARGGCDSGSRREGRPIAGDVKFGATNLFRVHISATTPNIADIERIEASDGRYFNKSEEEARRNVASSAPTWPTNCFPLRIRWAKRFASTAGRLR